VGSAFRYALVTGVMVEGLLLLFLRLWFGNLSDTLDLWFGLQATLGVVVGGLVYERTLAITPVRPQRVSQRASTSVGPAAEPQRTNSINPTKSTACAAAGSRAW